MKEISINELNINPCLEIGKNWMLITAGDEHKSNSMTASWGSIGALWEAGINGGSVTTIYVRPSRYTDSFIDQEDYYSLCFFEEEYRKDLLFMGSNSGKDMDKVSHTKLHLDYVDGVPFYKEAKLVIICKKIYKGKIMKEGFIDKKIIDTYYKDDSNDIYNNESFHNVYVGKITKILQK